MQSKTKESLSPAQDTAANPLENVWVQANAGTGKTSVLVQRLLRILYRASKAGILCLTYTNAGASEMRNRILAALRKWARATDDELREMLHGVAIGEPDTNHARSIFYTYIDNPDMLKIKTIHGFCEEILRRFPIEAGVSPSWKLISDSAQRILLNDAFHHLINDKNNDIADAFAHIVGRISEHSFDDLLGILTGQYKEFFKVENDFNYREYFIDTTRKYLNLDSPVQTEILHKNLQNIIDLAKSDKKPTKTLEKIINLTEQYIDNTINFDEYKNAYLTSTGTQNINVSKKEYLTVEQSRVYALEQHRLNQQIFDDTVALFDLSAAFAKKYQQLKSERNVLDFDDLILYTRRLFSAPDTMGWVLSQLDLSLNHILVDEAQDTSPEQWDILRSIAGDFFVTGDTDNPRSLFVVGDTKQSIYGFQGADPAAFAASRESIAIQIRENLRTIREVPLEQSFRSSAPILRAVDHFFNTDHKVFRAGAPGCVELHNLVSKERNEYIKTIADKIQSLIAGGQFSAGDIMVLVQRRNPFAPLLVNELKRRSIDVAGSDRIVLPEFPAIRDLLNLVRFCIDAGDDYALSCVLKSPLFGLNEADIYKLCNGRTGTVFDALDGDLHGELSEIIEWSKTMAPYSFFMRVLETRRAKIIAALGNQIVDPLEEFLTICLAYERTQPGTLRHFIKWFITGGSEIKRDMDASAGVRIVTVHGSKGLEAPVVFLIDTVRTPRDKPEKVIQMDDAWLWSPRATNSELMATAAEKNMEKKIAEYDRLLYVAMTRARDHLYIYGYTPHRSAHEISWHARLSALLPSMTGVEINDKVICIS